MRPLVILAFAACSSAPPAASAPAAAAVEPATPPTSGAPEVQIRFTVEHASLRDAAGVLSRATGQPVIIGSAVEPVADCLRLTVLNPDPVPASTAVEQIRSAVAQSGVDLEVAESELRFLAREGTEPTCPRSRPPIAEGSSSTRHDAPEAFRAGVTEVSETEWTIRRAATEAVAEQNVMRSARVIPHQENGRVIGVKLYGVRRGSVLGILGIRNGDLLQTVNGYDMSSPDSALEAYAELRGAERFVVALIRRGQPRIHTYRIID